MLIFEMSINHDLGLFDIIEIGLDILFLKKLDIIFHLLCIFVFKSKFGQNLVND